MSTKKRILFIMHMPPPVHGAAMMGKFIHDSPLIRNEFDCNFINLSTANSLSDVGTFRPRKILYIFKQCSRIFRTAKRFNPDLVYITPNSHGLILIKELFLLQRIKRMGFPVIAHFHNKGVAARQDIFFYDFIYRRFFKNIKLILLSESLYRDVCRYISRDNVCICANGIPESENLCEYPKTGIPHVLFLSNLLPDKGVFVLLDAVKMLKGKKLEFVCDIIGAETKMINATIFADEVSKRGIEDVIKYHGPIYGHEKEMFWKNTSLFVFPSLNECFALVLLEAMQHGISVVATDEGGTPDIVEDGKTGFIIPKFDAVVLAEKMEYLLTHPAEAEAMGRAGYEKYQNQFQLQIWEKRLCEILIENTK